MSCVSELHKGWPNNTSIISISSFCQHINNKKTKYTGVFMRICVYRLPTNQLNGTTALFELSSPLIYVVIHIWTTEHDQVAHKNVEM